MNTPKIDPEMLKNSQEICQRQKKEAKKKDAKRKPAKKKAAKKKAKVKKVAKKKAYRKLTPFGKFRMALRPKRK